MTPEEVYDCERAERLAWEAKRDGGVSRRDLLARAALGAAVLSGLGGAARL
jgi:hypothetical protein